MLPIFLLTVLVASGAAGAEEAKGKENKFLGAQSCSSTSCHGGAASNSFQHTIWSMFDPHGQGKSFATLTTRRSDQITETLKADAATRNTRCTVCHAPFHEVPAPQRAEGVKPSEGVSCETCHGPAEAWLRSHTRKDYTHADRVQAGMRDLKNLYGRANGCVACHQNLDADIEAIHPDLTFELDGQCVTMRKHWREKPGWFGPQAWLVGQAVALREMSWQLSKDASPTNDLSTRWSGLLWVMQQTGELSAAPPESTTTSVAAVKIESDEVARRLAGMEWSADTTRKILARLAATSPAFRESSVPVGQQARRAERLVIGLDRLAISLDKDGTWLKPEIDRLYRLVQSLPQFKPDEFSQVLDELARKLGEGNEK